MEMMGGALGAIAGLVGAGLSYSAQQTANVINMMNLQFQKQQAAKQLHFAQAGRQDQFGNETKFDDALNEWVMNLTPTQKQISKASEREQLLQLTEDAKRNRQIKEAAYQRGQEAAPDYARVMADWRYNQPKSEMAITDELTSLLAGAKQDDASKSKATLIQQALRQGQGGTIPSIIQGVNNDAGQSLSDILLKARAGGQQEFQARTQAHNQNDLPVLAQLEQMMEAGGSAPTGGAAFNPGAALGQMQSQGNAAILQALQSGTSGVGSAYKALAASEGKSPNFAGIAKSLDGMGKSGNKGQQQPAYSLALQDQLDDAEADGRTISSYGDF